MSTPAMTDQEHVFKPHRPAVFYDRDSGTLLAFADQTSDLDGQTSHIIMKEASVKLEPNKLKNTWIRTNKIEQTAISGHRTMNPCPVYDKNKKKLFLFFICVEGTTTLKWQTYNGCNKSRLCYITSDDLGHQWSEVMDLTACLPEKCSAFAVGPGHGIQTEEGRLIIPSHVYIGEFPPWPVPQAVALYSDDGETWQFGEPVPEESGACQMAEVKDPKGRFIYCNASQSGSYRMEAFSYDNGKTFTAAENPLLGDTVFTGQQGSVISFPAPAEAGSDPSTTWLLYSQSTHVLEKSDLGVYLNKTPSDILRWDEPWVLNEDYCGHTDLTYIDDGWFACLSEHADLYIPWEIDIRYFHLRDINPQHIPFTPWCTIS